MNGETPIWFGKCIVLKEVVLIIQIVRYFNYNRYKDERNETKTQI